MRHHDDEWLQQKIEEDIIAIADKREQELKMKSFYPKLDLSEEKQQELREKILKEMDRHDVNWADILGDEPEAVSTADPGQITSAIEVPMETVVHRRFRWRPVFVAAAVLVLCLGLGMVGTGSKVYVPEIFRSQSGDEETLKIENTDSNFREYNEEDVCVEIEEKIGAIPPRLMYRPKGMLVAEYNIQEAYGDALVRYTYDKRNIYVYVSKDWKRSSISNQVDGLKKDIIMIVTCGLDVPIYEYQDEQGNNYYEASFEYLNTYYSIKGMIDIEEFKKILENIAIKNA